METEYAAWYFFYTVLFKSYYVVWKREAISHTVDLFKSYYVVWKLCDSVVNIEHELGLNRTM